MEKLIRVIRLEPGESVLVLAPEIPPTPPTALLFTAEPPCNDEADGIAVLLRVV